MRKLESEVEQGLEPMQESPKWSSGLMNVANVCPLFVQFRSFKKSSNCQIFCYAILHLFIEVRKVQILKQCYSK